MSHLKEKPGSKWRVGKVTAQMPRTNRKKKTGGKDSQAKIESRVKMGEKKREIKTGKKEPEGNRIIQGNTRGWEDFLERER